MKKKLTKIILAVATVAVLAVPLMADARGRSDGDGLGNGFTGIGFGGGSAVGPRINGRQGLQNESPLFFGPTGHSSGPGLDTGSKGSRLKDGNGSGSPAK